MLIIEIKNRENFINALLIVLLCCLYFNPFLIAFLLNFYNAYKAFNIILQSEESTTSEILCRLISKS